MLALSLSLVQGSKIFFLFSETGLEEAETELNEEGAVSKKPELEPGDVGGVLNESTWDSERGWFGLLLWMTCRGRRIEYGYIEI